MNKPLDRDLIARAMKRAGEIALHGTPDQKAGKFSPSLPEATRQPKRGAA